MTEPTVANEDAPRPRPNGMSCRTIAIGIVADDAEPPRVLISLRRDDAVLGGYWEFPGGKVEPGERIEDALRRELREELAIDAEPTRALTPIAHDYPHGAVRLVPFLCSLASSSAPPRARQVAEWRWVAARDLADYRFPEANASLVAEVVRVLGA